jgi:hypothetical protein
MPAALRRNHDRHAVPAGSRSEKPKNHRPSPRDCAAWGGLVTELLRLHDKQVLPLKAHLTGGRNPSEVEFERNLHLSSALSNPPNHAEA